MKKRREEPLSIVETVDLDFAASKIYDEIFAKYEKEIMTELRKRLRKEHPNLIPKGTRIINVSKINRRTRVWPNDHYYSRMIPSAVKDNTMENRFKMITFHIKVPTK